MRTASKASPLGDCSIPDAYLGLDFNAVFKVAEAFGITPGPSFISKLRIFEREALKLFAAAGQEKQARCNDAERQKCVKKYGKHLAWTCQNCDKRAA